MENDSRHWFGGRASKWIDAFIKVVQTVNSITALCMYMYSAYMLQNTQNMHTLTVQTSHTRVRCAVTSVE